jgi:hypothetical protein
MITIEHLEVRFETERERDEVRFGELFALHLTRHEAARQEQKAIQRQADADRSLDCGRPW